VFQVGFLEPLLASVTASMSTAQQDSSLQIVLKPVAKGGPKRSQSGVASKTSTPEQPGSIYLDGGVLACACPDCGAPMTVRLWLLTADCWRCQASIELTPEQEEEALRLLEQAQQEQPEPPRQERASVEAPAPAAPPKHSEQRPVAKESPAPAKPPVETRPATRQSPAPSPAPDARKPSTREAPKRGAPRPPAREKQPPAPEAPQPASKPTPAPTAPPRQSSLHEESRFLRLKESAQLRGSELWSILPACLVSLIVHLLAMIILGLWMLDEEETGPQIVLTATVGPQHREGGEPSEIELNPNEFELPVDKPPENEQEREALVKADQDARELRFDADADQRNLPPLQRVRNDLKSTDPYKRMHAARDPRIRAEIVSREGGTTLTEAAVARALRWMSEHQNQDGSWSLHRTNQGKPYANPGHVRSDAGGTALVLMAMLGTGQTHKAGRYREHVARGLQYLLSQQKENGDLRDTRGNQGMYVHGQAAIVLCDAFKLTGDEALRAPAQKAIDFIVGAQYDDGGWRYEPKQDVPESRRRSLRGDTSVVGWQLMAMHSARSAYLDVPDRTGDRAQRFLDRVQADREGGLYAYTPRRGPSPAMTAEGLLSRMYLGWNRDDPGLEKGVEWMRKRHMPRAQVKNIYYWYYATQVMHHWGGEPWEEWNAAMRDVLVRSQVSSGPEAGSWDPRGHPHGGHGGRLYVTALATCTLEVYYRYAPLYWQLDLD